MSVEFKKDENGRSSYPHAIVDTTNGEQLYTTFLDDAEAISLRDQLLAAFPIEAPKPVDDTVPMRRLTREQAGFLLGVVRGIRSGESVAVTTPYGDCTSSEALDAVLKAVAYCFAGGEEP